MLLHASPCTATPEVQLASPAGIAPITVGRSKVEAHGHCYTLQVAERRLVSRLGNKPWTADLYDDKIVAEAYAMWSRLAIAAGMNKAGWFTDGRSNTKLGKSGFPTVGITFHADRSAGRAWQSADPMLRANIAACLDMDEADISRALDVTLCPHAGACRQTCVTDMSAHAMRANTQRTRLLRDLFMVVCPELALAMTADGLRRVRDRAGGRMHARWRVNVSDDIRWEVVAPGLLEFAPAAYTYTKWPIAARPAVDGVSVVYSADERWSDEDIVVACQAGHRVAVVFAVGKGQLPEIWNGVKVSDGDSTDDLYEHRYGTIVGLHMKGPTRDVKAAGAASGFARAV